MNELDKSLRTIKNCQKGNEISRFIMILSIIAVCLSDPEVNLERMCLFIVIFGIAVIVSFILNKVNKTIIITLKDEHDHLKIINYHDSIFSLIDSRDTVFLKGPNDQTNKMTAIIAIQQDNSVKKIMIRKECVKEIFDLE